MSNLFTSPVVTTRRALTAAATLSTLAAVALATSGGPAGNRRHRRGGDAGQSTAEYALVMLGAAAIAMLLLTWATKTGAIGGVFDWVVGQVMGRAK